MVHRKLMEVNISSFLVEIRIRVRHTQVFFRMRAQLTKLVFLGLDQLHKSKRTHGSQKIDAIQNFILSSRDTNSCSTNPSFFRMCAQLTKLIFPGLDQLH